MPELIEYPCRYPECGNTVMGFSAMCGWCNEVWCADHTGNDLHGCMIADRIEPFEDSINELRHINEIADIAILTKLLNQVNKHKQTFISQAKDIRPGHECTIDIPSDFQTLQESKWYAGYNVHFLITFDDGIKWLLRVRQSKGGHRLPRELTEPVIQSEVTTLNLLKSYGVPVPAAYLPHRSAGEGDTGENDIGLAYFFIEFMDGTPLDLPTGGYFGEITLPEDKMNKFIQEYARIQIQLSNLHLPFKKIECIYPSKDNDENGHGTETGPIVAKGCLMNPKPPHFMGPFSTLQELYLTKIDAGLRYSKTNSLQGQLPVDEYLWHLELKELVSASKVLAEVPEELFIVHDDKKGDEMMVDEDGNVIGIIDWEWAYVTTKADAFHTPWVFNRTFAYMKNGLNELTHAENLLIAEYERQNRKDLADCVRGGRLYLRLRKIGYYDPAFNKNGFREVFGKDIPKDFDPPMDNVDWRVYMIKRYSNNEGLKEVMDRFGWTLERAEKEAEEWHRDNDNQ